MPSTTADLPAPIERVTPDLVLVHDPRGQWTGRRIVVLDPTTLGRAYEWFDEGYRSLSREHAVVEPTATGLRVRDLGSRNGTRVNDKSVVQADVTFGDVLEIGGLVFVVARPVVVEALTAHPRIHGCSSAIRGLLGEARALGESRSSAIVCGPAGAGKTLLADEIVRLRGESGASETVDCEGEDALARIEAAARSNDTATIVLDALDRASLPVQRAASVMLRQQERRPVLASCSGADAALPADLRERLPWVVHVPALRDRREDILDIARAKLRALSPTARALAPDLVRRLLLDPWAGNVRTLVAFVERAYRLATDAAAPIGPPPYGGTGSEQDLVVARDGSWFALDGSRTALGGRPIARVLAALAAARASSTEEALSISEIAKHAWPNERIVPSAASNRVHVALSKLRKLGLEGVLDHAEGGYRFAPHARIRVVDVIGSD